jgi:hypothetical protein
MNMVVEKPLSVVIVYSLALGAIYKASYRGLTVSIGRPARGAVLMLETYQEVTA